MSNSINLTAASIAESSDTLVAGSLGQRVAGIVARWKTSWREMLALRRCLDEISQLSERELLDIGLQHDEIARLRSSEYFMPRSWQSK